MRFFIESPQPRLLIVSLPFFSVNTFFNIFLTNSNRLVGFNPNSRQPDLTFGHETFTSIAGVGDLDVTCKSKYGRNRRFGQDIIKTDLLTKFKDLDDLIANIGKVGYLPEGAVACKYIHELGQKKGLKLFITDSLYRILNKEITPMQLMDELLSGSMF